MDLELLSKQQTSRLGVSLFVNSNSFLDPLETLRTTLAEIDSEPGPLTPELVLIRELLELHSLRCKSGSEDAVATVAKQ